MRSGRVRYIGILAMLSAVICIALVWQCADHAKPRIGAMVADAAIDPAAEDCDYGYPNLPRGLAMPTGDVIVPLDRADSLQEVVGWAERNLTMAGPRYVSTGSDGSGAECFVVLYDTGSGAYVWQYLVYIGHGIPGAQKWQLLCAGPVGTTSGRYVLSSVYIDKTGHLVFAMNGGGIIRSVEISSAIEAFNRLAYPGTPP